MLWLSSCVGFAVLQVLTKCNMNVMVPAGAVRRVACAWPLAEPLSMGGGVLPPIPVLVEDGPLCVCAQ